MDKYARQIKLRLIWWITWWSLITLSALIYVISTIDMFMHYDLFSHVERFATLLWLIIFGLISLNFVPSTEYLLKKDLKTNPDNIYAKSMLLERELKKRRDADNADKERGDLERKVKAMQDELGEKE